MKKLLLAGLLICSVTQVQAQFNRQPGMSGQSGRNPGKMKEKILQRFDLDGDGVLSDEERAAAQQAMPRGRKGGQKQGPGQDRQPGQWQQPGMQQPGMQQPGMQPQHEKMQQLQKQLDNVLVRLQAESPEKYQKLIERYDANSDKKLDDVERGNMLAEKHMRKMTMMRFDQDRDGQLNEAEKSNLEQEHQKQMQAFAQQDPQRFQGLLQKFDQNADKNLQFEEWAQALRSGAVPPPMPPGRQGMPGQMQGMGQNQGGFQQQPMQGRPANGQWQNQQHPGQHPGQWQNQNQQQQQQSPQVPDDGGLLDGISIGTPSEPAGDDDALGLDFLDF